MNNHAETEGWQEERREPTYRYVGAMWSSGDTGITTGAEVTLSISGNRVTRRAFGSFPRSLFGALRQATIPSVELVGYNLVRSLKDGEEKSHVSVTLSVDGAVVTGECGEEPDIGKAFSLAFLQAINGH